MSTSNSTSSPKSWAMWAHIFAGLSASFIGIGLARFAYTPLIPSLIRAHWFSANDVVYLGAANLAGYLLGAIIGRPIAARINNVNTVRLMKVLATLSFFACAFPISVSWFFCWRLASGIAGGTIMVLVAATVLPHVPSHKRGTASGAVFLGLGLGIAASGTIVPLLLSYGLKETWIGLGVISAVLTALGWFSWPPALPPAPKAGARIEAGSADGMVKILICTEYALMAIGLVPPMVFLVDFVARGLGAGEHVGAMFWILYGIGAIFGPPAYGFFADRLGPRRALRILLLLQACAVVGLAISGNRLLLGVVIVVIGSFPPGIVPLMLACIRGTYADDTTRQNIVWSQATIVFAAFQALAGYAYSALFAASGGDHRLLFEIGAGAIAIAFALDLFLLPYPRRKQPAGS
ncbi:MAG TPA: YbfB/YjiJ family MFS transporter [Stellaceae bacterium]|nr:YbfB/YjiJ family MFS transporter [Stellaceae bacterium]